MFAPVLFLCLSTLVAIEALPFPLVQSVTDPDAVISHEVTNSIQAGAVLGNLAIQAFIVPLAWAIVKIILTPCHLLRKLLILPYTIAKFIWSLPVRIILLPLTILTSPIEVLRHIGRTIVSLATPGLRLGGFIFKVVLFLLGQPIRVFNNRYVYL